MINFDKHPLKCIIHKIKLKVSIRFIEFNSYEKPPKLNLQKMAIFRYRQHGDEIRIYFGELFWPFFRTESLSARSSLDGRRSSTSTPSYEFIPRSFFPPLNAKIFYRFLCFRSCCVKSGDLKIFMAQIKDFIVRNVCLSDSKALSDVSVFIFYFIWKYLVDFNTFDDWHIFVIKKWFIILYKFFY